MQPTIPTTRKSLPLSAQDVHDLALMRESPVHREALSDLTGSAISDTASEAAYLKALVEAGINAVRHRIEEEGYAQIAAQVDGDQRQRQARRRTPSWGQE